VAAAARLLGRRLTPWQRRAADLYGTLTPDGRRLYYRRCPLIVPRRAGKTLLILAFAIALMRRRSMTRAFYASHRRETAAAMWRDDWFPMIEHSPLHPRYVSVRRSNGSEAVTFRHNLSTLRLLPPDGDVMRSFRSDLAFVDEAREFTAEQGAEFEAAAFPTQATGLGGQFWPVSNAGAGAWLRRWRDLGRASVADPTSQIAYLEYGAPDGADPHLEATWWAAHPGLGYHVNLDAVRADHETMSPDDFAAEYLGIWPEALVDSELVAGWAAGIDQAAAPADPVVLALEVSTDRTRAVIVAAGDNGDGRAAVELLEARPHDAVAVVARLAELVARHYPAALVWDAAGPVGALAHDLADLSVNLRPLNTRDVMAAAGAAHDAAVAGRIAHRDDPALSEAVTAARQRPAGGAWLYDRRAVESLPWIAATLARWQWSDGRIRPPNVA
jgi:phage terminase large subunit-like protein